MIPFGTSVSVVLSPNLLENAKNCHREICERVYGIKDVAKASMREIEEIIKPRTCMNSETEELKIKYRRRLE